LVTFGAPALGKIAPVGAEPDREDVWWSLAVVRPGARSEAFGGKGIRPGDSVGLIDTGLGVSGRPDTGLDVSG
jgi:hypothetical protein